MSSDCDRARQWASVELDGELSTFESVLMRAHLAGCADCRDFRASISGLTGALRVAPLERFEGVSLPSRHRRRPRLRLAPAAAAMAVAAVGLGSVLASSAIHSKPVGAPRSDALVANSGPIGLDTMNLRTSTALERLNAFQQIRISKANRSLRGGPVLQER
jgi:hypothetical protein